mgnify:CR=1 FL=1|jgi:hypothetical protein
MLFKVIQGPHWINGIEYPPGSEIESGSSLDKIFPGRFEKIKEKKIKQEDLIEKEIDNKSPEKKKRVRRKDS